MLIIRTSNYNTLIHTGIKHDVLINIIKRLLMIILVYYTNVLCREGNRCNNIKPQLQPLQYGIFRQSFVVFTQKQILKCNMVPKYKVHALAKCKESYGCFLLGYVNTLFCLTQNHQVKHWLISMPQMFLWLNIEYKQGLF